MPSEQGSDGIFLTAKLCAEHFQTFCNWFKGLFTCRPFNTANNHLRAQQPVFGDIPRFGNRRIGQGIVMLQVCTYADRGKCRPNGILHHRVRLVRPNGKVGGISRELLLQTFDNILIFIKQNSCRTRLKQLQFLRGRFKTVGRHDGTQRVFDKLPHLIMLFAKQHDHAGRLGIKRRRRVQNGVFDDLDDFIFADGQIFI